MDLNSSITITSVIAAYKEITKAHFADCLLVIFMSSSIDLCLQIAKQKPRFQATFFFFFLNQKLTINYGSKILSAVG